MGHLIIKCGNCGRETSIINSRYFRPFRSAGNVYIETSLPIRCPECMFRLNRSEGEFLGQVAMAE